MKIFKSLFISCLLLVATISVTSCGGNQAAETAGKEFTSAYVCPMHCAGSGSETMGTCPKCNMDYVAKKEHEKDGHKH